jgi:glucuronate isomerase
MTPLNTPFIHDKFLLQSDLAEQLYKDFAEHQPIIDYHSHLSPFEIATNKQYKNITDVWLRGDHYKWRAMRWAGINEDLITGQATDEEKFHAWAKTMPLTVRNPLFHWSQLELKNSFDVVDLLNPANASNIYQHCNELLQQNDHRARSFAEKYKVEYICTTDDPVDNLEYHQQIKNDSSCAFSVAPSFRPDKAFFIADATSFIQYIHQLSKASGIEIKDMESLLGALQSRVDYFFSLGCKISDHGLKQIPAKRPFSSALSLEFNDFLLAKGEKPFSDPDAFAFHVLVSVCKMYHAKGWVQQFHLGALRNNNARLLSKLGADAGVDSIGDFDHAERMSAFLNTLDETDQLSKTILYNLNPADNPLFATMCGNFNDGSVAGKVQFGAAWWFGDQKNGMEDQLDILSDMGLLSTFVGMLTDSRSMLSFSRHEYFRRILCNVLADDMLKGIIPNDKNWIGSIIERVCYGNAKEYFGV